MPTCSVDGCDLRATRKGLCGAHYFRLRRNGSVGVAALKGPPPPCAVAGCKRKHEAHGFCLLHGRRVKKGGDPDFIGTLEREANPAWRGDHVGYTAAHERVYRARGPAKNQQCRQCGHPAKHWAYTHSDPNQLVTPEGLPYSGDPAFYEALCVPCHKSLDLAR